jgi:hypothetical protein
VGKLKLLGCIFSGSKVKKVKKVGSDILTVV